MKHKQFSKEVENESKDPFFTLFKDVEIYHPPRNFTFKVLKAWEEENVVIIHSNRVRKGNSIYLIVGGFVTLMLTSFFLIFMALPLESKNPSTKSFPIMHDFYFFEEKYTNSLHYSFLISEVLVILIVVEFIYRFSQFSRHQKHV